MSESLVAVKTSSGSFASERAIQLELASGQQVSLFADKSLVDTRNNAEFLRVAVIKTDSVAKTRTVLLPSETFETMSRWAIVAQDKLIDP
jgi:hypothetical protein